MPAGGDGVTFAHAFAYAVRCWSVNRTAMKTNTVGIYVVLASELYPYAHEASIHTHTHACTHARRCRLTRLGRRMGRRYFMSTRRAQPNIFCAWQPARPASHSRFI